MFLVFLMSKIITFKVMQKRKDSKYEIVLWIKRNVL